MEIPNEKLCGKCNKPKSGEGDLCKCGRPNLYDLIETPIKAREYIKDAEDKFTNLQKDEKKAAVLKLVVNLPSIEGLALYLKVSRETIYKWAEDHEEFSDILDELRAKQANVLLNKGLSGDYNPTIAKLILSKHGYKESTEQDITQKTYIITEE